jgi:predicted Kef-type K+ transport protein
MQAATVPSQIPRDAAALPGVRERLRDDVAYQAFILLRIAFTVAPILFGVDKFFNLMVNWESYLAPWIHDLIGLSASHTMHIVGVIEIAAGVAVAVRPRYGAYLVAAWLGGIVINLLTYSGYYDIALRDFGLMLGALTLARLSGRYDAA